MVRPAWQEAFPPPEARPEGTPPVKRRLWHCRVVAGLFSERRAALLQAEAIFPRPVSGLLRPAVRPPTQRYNMKLRPGKGFTLQELKVRWGLPIQGFRC